MSNYILEDIFNKLIDKYGEDRILWVAAADDPGMWVSHNNDEPPISACYLPTEQELYLTYPNKNKDLIDIRLIKDNLEELMLAPYMYINPKYKDLVIDNFFNNKNIFTDDLVLYHAIYNVVNQSFDVPSNEQELIEILTKTEIKVLNNIINEFNKSNEGDIRVSYYSEQWNISTSVFRTLFYKLKEYRVAEVDSRGVKGTHIKFNNIKTLINLIDKIK